MKLLSFIQGAFFAE